MRTAIDRYIIGTMRFRMCRKKLGFERRIEAITHWPSDVCMAAISEIDSLEQRMHRERINHV
jgi:hypothetical protein